MVKYRIGDHGNAVNIITRLIIKFLSGEYLTNLCRHIGLSNFILYNGEVSNAEEDIFEAWIGACKLIYEPSQFSSGVFKLFDMFPISFSFQDLYDPRSILNDFSSAIQTKMVNRGTRKVSISNAQEYENKTIIGGDVIPMMIGVGYAKTKKHAEQESARKILDNYISVFGVENFFEQLKKTKTYLKWRDFFLSYNKCC
jgi:dsRNA-specific ribonuclease